DEWLISNRNATYLLKVIGDSMCEAGVLEGDTVILDRSLIPKPGDMVVAESDGGWTIKYLRQKTGKYYLEAANSNYPDLYPKEELKIAGVVTGLVRKF
ncbi:MAG TPA: S24 family peptidase, partial [Candidatus Gracilibacteria bacterium]|nr:S24 family peptidase [Candidatus Gracilibacteria bacterium]